MVPLQDLTKEKDIPMINAARQFPNMSRRSSDCSDIQINVSRSLKKGRAEAELKKFEFLKLCPRMSAYKIKS